MLRSGDKSGEGRRVMTQAVEIIETFEPWTCGCGRTNPIGGTACQLCGTRKGISFADRARENPAATFMDGYLALCGRYGASPVDVHIRDIDACSPSDLAELLECIERQLADEG